MKVSLIQSNLYWEDREKNLQHLAEHIAGCEQEQDLILLPEMFSTGFTMKPEVLAEAADGPTLGWMKKQAEIKQSNICGSVSVSENGNFYNRLYFVTKTSHVRHYDKRHLFRMGAEDQHYKNGENKIICDVNEWKVMPLVCYDLRFPVWSRNRFDKEKNRWDYDVLVYVANWPAVRSYPWKQLLIARAIENQCYVLGVNRVGNDGNGMEHSGNSMVIGPKGEIIAELADGSEGILSANLDMAELQKFRSAFPVGLDSDRFQIWCDSF